MEMLTVMVFQYYTELSHISFVYYHNFGRCIPNHKGIGSHQDNRQSQLVRRRTNPCLSLMILSLYNCLSLLNISTSTYHIEYVMDYIGSEKPRDNRRRMFAANHCFRR